MELWMDKFIKKRFLILLFLGIISGTLFANIYGKNHISDWGIFDNVYFEKYNSITINYSSLWTYVAQTRIRDIIFVSIISLTSISATVFFLYLFYIGSTIGLVISMASMQYGIKGVWVYVVSVFPQYIFYGLALFLIIKMIDEKKRSDFSKSRYGKGITIIVSIILVIIGCCAEVYLNPGFMKTIIFNQFL